MLNITKHHFPITYITFVNSFITAFNSFIPIPIGVSKIVRIFMNVGNGKMGDGEMERWRDGEMER